MMSNAIRLWREKVTGDFPHLEGLPQLPWPWSSLPGQVIDEISVSLGKVPCFRKLEFMDGSRFPLPCYLNSYLLVWHEVGICEDLPSERCISPEQRSILLLQRTWLGQTGKFTRSLRAGWQYCVSAKYGPWQFYYDDLEAWLCLKEIFYCIQGCCSIRLATTFKSLRKKFTWIELATFV